MEAKEEKPFSFSLITLVHWAGQDVAQYLAFSAELETLLESGHAKLEESIDEKLNSVSKEVQEELIDSYAWDLHLSSSFFPELQRESMFVTLYSYLEHNLNTVCDEIGKEIGSRVRRKDLHGRGVIRALDYLKLVPEFG